jgi:beta-galactosidase GanA
MGLINPARGVFDFDSFRSLQLLFDTAREVGFWIVLRPGISYPLKFGHFINQANVGPYINAETSAGGISHWITSEVAGTLRTNASDYRDAWLEYINKVIELTIPNQMTEGGPVIGVYKFFSHF